MRASATSAVRRSHLREPRHEQRKTVTVLFCDVTGSTALGESTDPEALRALLARYFERMKGDRRVARRHGGEVHRRRGHGRLRRPAGARGRRAAAPAAPAVEMRDALPELGRRRRRIGVNTGEVVTGTEERLATGDAVNVAARLEQAAQPGRDPDRRGDARSSSATPSRPKPVEPLELKGKAEPVPAHRLVTVHERAGAPARDALRRQVERAGELAERPGSAPSRSDGASS